MSGDIDIVDRLRINWTSLTDKQNAERNEAADEIKRLRAERDDARQRLCKVVGDNRDMWGEDVAKEYGWDCFKEASE
jgi:hypothetical protein